MKAPVLALAIESNVAELFLIHQNHRRRVNMDRKGVLVVRCLGHALTGFCNQNGVVLYSGSSATTLLPRCYQDRTNHPHLGPSRLPPELWFLVRLGCLRLDLAQFVNRRSPVQSGSPAPYIFAELQPAPWYSLRLTSQLPVLV